MCVRVFKIRKKTILKTNYGHIRIKINCRPPVHSSEWTYVCLNNHKENICGKRSFYTCSFKNDYIYLELSCEGNPKAL